MSKQAGGQHTLTDDQIRVSENVRSAIDILRESKPYLDAAQDAMKDCEPENYSPIKVPPNVFRDLVAILTAEAKRSQVYAGAQSDSGDGDWNPFNGIDFEFD